MTHFQMIPQEKLLWTDNSWWHHKFLNKASKYWHCIIYKRKTNKGVLVLFSVHYRLSLFYCSFLGLETLSARHCSCEKQSFLFHWRFWTSEVEVPCSDAEWKVVWKNGQGQGETSLVFLSGRNTFNWNLDWFFFFHVLFVTCVILCVLV